MSEGTYEYECNRAELLGINPPSRDKWEEEAERVRGEKEQAEKMTVWEIKDCFKSYKTKQTIYEDGITHFIPVFKHKGKIV